MTESLLEALSVCSSQASELPPCRLVGNGNGKQGMLYSSTGLHACLLNPTALLILKECRPGKGRAAVTISMLVITSPRNVPDVVT